MLRFPANSNTSGQGNAQVIQQPSGGWRIFWNGQVATYERGDGPKNLFVGDLRWSTGKPYVSGVLPKS